MPTWLIALMVVLFASGAQAAPAFPLQRGELPEIWRLDETVVCMQGNCKNGTGIEWRFPMHEQTERKGWARKGPVLVRYGSFVNQKLQGPGRVLALYPDDLSFRQRYGFIKPKPDDAMRARLVDASPESVAQQFDHFRWLEANFEAGQPVGPASLITQFESYDRRRIEGTIVDGHFQGPAREWRNLIGNPQNFDTGTLRYGLRHGFWRERHRANDAAQPQVVYVQYLAGQVMDAGWRYDATQASRGGQTITSLPYAQTNTDDPDDNPLPAQLLDDGSLYHGELDEQGRPAGFGSRLSADGMIEETGLFADGVLEGEGLRISWLDRPWLRFAARKPNPDALNYYLQHLHMERGRFSRGVLADGMSAQGGLSYRINWAALYNDNAYGHAGQTFQHEREGGVSWVQSRSFDADGKTLASFERTDLVTPYENRKGGQVIFFDHPSYLAAQRIKNPDLYGHVWAGIKAADERLANSPLVRMGREAAEHAQKKAMAEAVEKERRNAARKAQINAGSNTSGSDDGRSHQRRLNDKIWWDNFHRCGSGKC